MRFKSRFTRRYSWSSSFFARVSFVSERSFFIVSTLFPCFSKNDLKVSLVDSEVRFWMSFFSLSVFSVSSLCLLSNSDILSVNWFASFSILEKDESANFWPEDFIWSIIPWRAESSFCAAFKASFKSPLSNASFMAFNSFIMSFCSIFLRASAFKNSSMCSPSAIFISFSIICWMVSSICLSSESTCSLSFASSPLRNLSSKFSILFWDWIRFFPVSKTSSSFCFWINSFRKIIIFSTSPTSSSWNFCNSFNTETGMVFSAVFCMDCRMAARFFSVTSRNLLFRFSRE